MKAARRHAHRQPFRSRVVDLLVAVTTTFSNTNIPHTQAAGEVKWSWFKSQNVGKTIFTKLQGVRLYIA